MKNILLISGIILMNFGLFAQASIKVYTELEEETSLIMVWLNEDPQDAYPSDEVIMESLLPGKYMLQVSFNSDTIADWVKTIKLKTNEQLVYKVVKMKAFGKDIGKVGRGFGTKTGTTEGSDEDLIQYYRLEKVKED